MLRDERSEIETPAHLALPVNDHAKGTPSTGVMTQESILS